MQAVPGGGICGGYRRSRHGGQGLRQWRRQSRITGDERAPTCRVCDDTDPVTDLEVGDAGPQRGHHPGEVHAETRARPADGEVLSEREQDVGEIDTGGLHRHFDLTGLRRLAFGGDELEGLQIARGADAQPHAVAFGIDRGGAPFIGLQRTSPQPGDVPGTVPPRGGVLFGSAEQLCRHRCAVGAGVDVDLSGRQWGVFGADDAQQAGNPAVVDVDRVARRDVECASGDDVEARRYAVGIRQLAGDADQRGDEVASAIERMPIGLGGGRRRDHDDTPRCRGSDPGTGEGRGEPAGRRPSAVCTVGGHRVAELRGEPVVVIGGDQQPGARLDAGRCVR